MTFDQAAVTALYVAAVDKARKLSVFARVLDSEPKSTPGTGLSVAFAGLEIQPVRSSGLAATSISVVLTARIYMGRDHKPEKDIDPAVLAAACALIAAYSDDFTAGGTVREIDLLGQYGTPLGCRIGYLEQEGKPLRVGELTIPFIVNDAFTQEGS